MKLNGWIVENGAAYWRCGGSILTVIRSEDGRELERRILSAADKSGLRVQSRNEATAKGPGLFICLIVNGAPASAHRYITTSETPQDATAFAGIYRPEQVFQLISEENSRGGE